MRAGAVWETIEPSCVAAPATSAFNVLNSGPEVRIALSIPGNKPDAAVCCKVWNCTFSVERLWPYFVPANWPDFSSA